MNTQRDHIQERREWERTGLRRFWEIRGLGETADTGTAIILLRLLGYEQTRDSIRMLIHRGRVTAPEKVGRGWRWTFERVLDLAMTAHENRAFVPDPPPDLARMRTAHERAAAQEKLRQSRSAEGLEEAARESPELLATHDLDELLGVAIEDTDPDRRRLAVWRVRRLAGVGDGEPAPIDRLAQHALDSLAGAGDRDTREHLAALVREPIRELVAARAAPRTLPEMLGDLRSNDIEVRLRGGADLIRGAAAGLVASGASQLDIEHGAGRDLARLVARAVVGHPDAVDELEAVLTSDEDSAEMVPSEAPTTGSADRQGGTRR